MVGEEGSAKRTGPWPSVLGELRRSKKAMPPVRAGDIGVLMKVVKLYGKPDCHLCVEAQSVLRRLRTELDFELSEVDITSDEALHRAYFERIPVVTLEDEELFEYFVDEDALRQRLRSIL